MHRENTYARPGVDAMTATAEPPGTLGEPLELLRRYHAGQQELRRGVCLLNAGQYDQAARAFTAAVAANPQGLSLPRLLAACHVGDGRFDLAAANLEQVTRDEPDDVVARIRLALTLWKDARQRDAIRLLRRALISHPDSAELHFQLGTLLAAVGEITEAELRFAQVTAIDRNHSEALVSLALCCAAQQRVAEARRFLERAQRRRPHDARIGLLLAQAAQSLADQGTPVALNAEIPPAEQPDNEAIDQLSRIVQATPDFIDAFLALPTKDLDHDTFAMLAETLNRALEHQPDNVSLRVARGGILDRLGRAEEAIQDTEQAVDLDPRSIKALLQLARLYQQTDRLADARARLEEALEHQAEYADIYYLLGNLYRHDGEFDRARWAYAEALKINNQYEAARTALDSLAA